MNVVHFVVPDGIDDPDRPSGGNVYDRRVSGELAALGWSVHEHAVPGSWPTPAPADRAALGDVVSGIPYDAMVLVDGLVASNAPEALVPETRRLRLVILVHMPLADDPSEDGVAEAGAREGAVLSAAAAVVTSSVWTRRRLLDRHELRPDRVHVAEPGVDPADKAPGTATGGELLSVAAVTPNKGHDVLLTALATIGDLPWRCACVGSLNRDPGFVDRLHKQARKDGVSDRVRFTGPLTGAALDTAYTAADVLVLASRRESYGMVVTEALAHGLPVVASAIGGLPEALGRDPEGGTPGLLVAREDPTALADALRAWLSDADLRQRMRHSAEQRRAGLCGWSSTAERISRVLAEVA
ncbi:MAG: glycosyltransferase [Propionibacteriales bacterium]|nr:glycosyltransferase [Propionibacteriales bacterium]